MPRPYGRRESLLRRRRCFRSERTVRSWNPSLTRGPSTEEVSSNHNPNSKHGETDYRPSERYRGRKRREHSSRLGYPDSLRRSRSQTGLHRHGFGSRFRKQLLPNKNDRSWKGPRANHDWKNDSGQRG